MLKSFGINGAQGYFLERPNPDYRRAERARTARSPANSTSANALL